MTDTKMTGWQRAVVWIAGIGAVLLVAGYLTADQWVTFVGMLLSGGAH